ncbi:peroxisomal membrane protein PMP34-like isoform X2 [Dreissena polymorpha]|uniref:peroxisomal membrane protein PMP34-like isoform X2 n=1 Tax=Dreissena polymorpha TaxID=45954 RepID=UPI002264272E|nr:peroxisomal membrane protein PMP34-like isoform X2 [Dreissena polymorpha]
MSNIKSAKIIFVKVLASNDQGAMGYSALANVFSYTNLVHAVAGAVGSVVSMIVFYPLDTARTRLQVDDKRKANHTPTVIADIISQEGFTALYRGLVPVLTTISCSYFVYFYTYNCLKTAFIGKEKPSSIKDLSFAFIAGVVNVLVTTPLWVVNTRLKLQGAIMETEDLHDNQHAKYRGILDCLVKVARQEGVWSLWNGTKPSIVLASNPAIHFMVYEAVKRYFQHAFNQTELSGLVYFVIGAIAKTVATVRYRQSNNSSSTWDALMDIARTHGMSGLYKGMEAKLLQTVFTAALMFMVYEKLTAATFRMMGLAYVKPGQTLT